MVNFPNTHVRQRIGLDDNHYAHFPEQLTAKGYRDLGLINAVRDINSEEAKLIFSESFSEIYSTGRGYSIRVSELGKCFYTVDSSD